jgi:ABC-type multidrug transport system fused ATPase/permease subunit
MSLRQTSPDSDGSAGAPTSPVAPRTSASSGAADKSVLLNECDEGDASRRSIVQFTTGVTYVEEMTGKVEIIVMRIGCLQTECSVTYCTKEGTAGRGTKYEPIWPTDLTFKKKYEPIWPTDLTFKPGEYFKVIDLQLYDNDSYDNIVEVQLELADPAHCTLGIELRSMRVKIVDPDVFPSNKFKADVMKDYTTDGWRAGKDFSMMLEFWKLAFNKTKPGSIYILISDQVKNLIMIVNLTTMKYVIALLSNTTWSEASSAERTAGRAELLGYAFLLTLPYVISHYLSYKRQFWKVGGGARGLLLKGLANKYMYYEESTRELLDTDEFKIVFSEDSLQLVDKGFMNLFLVVKDIGRVAMVFVFLLVVSGYAGDGYVFLSLVPFFALPPMMIAYMWSRQLNSEMCREEALDAKVSLVHYLNTIVEQTTMVMAYFARPMVMDHFKKKIQVLNGCLVHSGVRMANDVAFFGWLQKLVIFIAVFLGGANVIGNHMDISTFTTILSALTSCCALFREMYLCFWDIQSVYPCLWHMVEYMNRPTDLKDRIKIACARENEFKERLRKQNESALEDDGDHAVDKLDITLKDVAFSYLARVETKGSPSPSSGALGIKNITMHIKQGQLIAVTPTKAGVGCKTLMRLLAGELLPHGESGEANHTCTSDQGLFVPPHLRLLHVSLKPTLWDGPIGVVVFFGLLVKHRYTLDMYRDLPDNEIKRGIQICRRLKIPDDVVQLIEADFPKVEATNSMITVAKVERARYGHRKVLSRISASTRIKIQLASALISDPPVLVLDKTLQFLSMKDAQAVMKCLREFVTYRGLEKGKDKDKMPARRPRTVIITSNNKLMLNGADLVVTMNESGIVSTRADIENIADEAEKELLESQKSVHTFSVDKKTKFRHTLTTRQIADATSDHGEDTLTV